MAVTIRDVADKAGVSPSTVSRVLNNNPRISTKTRKKVLKIMGELNYHPNNLARNFASQSSKMIGLIVDIDESEAFDNLYFHKITFGLEKVLNKRGYNLMFVNYNNHKSSEVFKNLIMEKKIDGIIFPTFMLDTKTLSIIQKNNFPFVLVGEPVNNKKLSKLNWVDIDNRLAGELVTNHLLEKNYEKTAFLGSSFDNAFSYKRFLGYQDMLNKNNIQINNNLVITDISDEDESYTEMRKLLQDYPEIDSVICVNNIIAYGALKAVKEENISIPDDFGIVTFDKYPLTAYLEPKLTTVDMNLTSIGIEAGRVLLNLIEGDVHKTEHILINSSLIESESTARESLNF